MKKNKFNLGDKIYIIERDSARKYTIRQTIVYGIIQRVNFTQYEYYTGLNANMTTFPETQVFATEVEAKKHMNEVILVRAKEDLFFFETQVSITKKTIEALTKAIK